MDRENIGPLTEKENIVKALIETENLFVIISKRTAIPFVECDKTTFDDQVLVFDKPEYVHNVLKRLYEEKQPVDAAVIARKERINFFASLCTMGVNCVLFNGYSEAEQRIQLDDIIRAPKGIMPDGQPWIENGAFHLTAIYFLQEIAKNPTEEAAPTIEALKEELLAHYSKGNFIIKLNDKGQLPIIKYPNGDSYQPIFTDIFEASKFNVEGTANIGAILAEKIPNVLSPNAKGVVVNPAGIGLQLPILRPTMQQPQPRPVQPAAAPQEEN